MSVMQGAMTVDELLALPSVDAVAWSDLPRTAGLYCVIDGHRQVVYVGVTTTSIRTRWMFHRHRGVFVEVVEPRIAYLVSEDAERLAQVEKATIYHLAPALNCLGLPRGRRPRSARRTSRLALRAYLGGQS